MQAETVQAEAESAQAEPAKPESAHSASLDWAGSAVWLVCDLLCYAAVIAVWGALEPDLSWISVV